MAPLRLLAARPTRRAYSYSPVGDVFSLVDATMMPWLMALRRGARRDAIDEDASLIYDFAEEVDVGLALTREQLVRVGKAIADDPILARAEISLIEYPDPTRDGNDAASSVILDDLVPSLRINRRELDFAREYLLRR